MKPASAKCKETIQVYRRNFQARLRHQLEAWETARQRALQAVLEKTPAILADWSSVQRAYLFGSVIRPGAFRTESDIDIAVEGATAQEYFALWQALENALPHWAIFDTYSATPMSCVSIRSGWRLS